MVDELMENPLVPAGADPRTGKLPLVVAVFYPDRDVETFTPPWAEASGHDEPARTSEVYLPQMIGSIQLAVSYSTDSVASPTQILASYWYTVGGNYKCRLSSTSKF